MDKLEAASASSSTVKWALYSIKGETGIDLGHPNTRAQIDQLVAGSVLTQAEGDALKALAERTGSRAEQRWGVGTVVTKEDFWRAYS